MSSVPVEGSSAESRRGDRRPMRSLLSALFILLVACIAGCRPVVDKPGAGSTDLSALQHRAEHDSAGRTLDCRGSGRCRSGRHCRGSSIEPVGTSSGRSGPPYTSRCGVVHNVRLPSDNRLRGNAEGVHRTLGSPAKYYRPRGPGAAERIVWQDSVTTFELVRDPTRSASTIYTRLLTVL